MQCTCKFTLQRKNYVYTTKACLYCSIDRTIRPKAAPEALPADKPQANNPYQGIADALRAMAIPSAALGPPLVGRYFGASVSEQLAYPAPASDEPIDWRVAPTTISPVRPRRGLR